jgi:hypothetical protein
MKNIKEKHKSYLMFLPVQLHEKFKEKCEKLKISMSSKLTELIENFIKEF